MISQSVYPEFFDAHDQTRLVEESSCKVKYRVMWTKLSLALTLVSKQVFISHESWRAPIFRRQPGCAMNPESGCFD